jgi:signal transduction histidine kinase
MKRELLTLGILLLIAACLYAGVPAPGQDSTVKILKQEFKEKLSADIFDFIMGIILTITGFAAIVISFSLLKGRYRSLLYLGLFTLLYGLRILSDNFITWYLFDSQPFLYYISPFITYVIPIPFILLFTQFVGWGWRFSIGWLLMLQTGYAGSAILIGIISGDPRSLMVPYNNLIVILDVVVAFGYLLFSELLKTAKIRGLKTGCIIIALTVINENLVSAELVPWRFRFEKLFFFILICFLAIVVIYYIFQQQKQLQRQLMQADKLIALGTLVSGAAHEINNPNNFILLNSEILARAWKDIDPILEKYAAATEDFSLAGVPYNEARENIPKFISDISRGAERIKNIVQNLKDYARPAPSDMTEKVAVNAACQSAVNLLANRIKKFTHHFSTAYQNPLPAVKGNFQRLEQVMINLLLNSLQALPGPDRGVTISTEYRENTDHLHIRVKDEGAGIPREHLGQVVNPFFTTKRDSGGLGLGLSICSTIIKDHGGQLQFDSRVGKGTTVTVTLPIDRE